MSGVATMVAMTACWAATPALCGCVEERRVVLVAADTQQVDASGEVGDAAGRCGDDFDCPAGNACQRPRCADARCSLEPVVCDDGDDCTTDSCDPASGCASAPAPVSTPCTTGPGSERCVGDAYHFQDRCDESGRCIDGGTEDCSAIPGGECFRYACRETEAGVGCDIAPRDDGTPCTADGLSGACIDGAQHGLDVCVVGECEEGGAAVCPTAFCEQAFCTGAGDCAARDIGVERSLSGNWRLIELYAAGTAGAPRVGAVDYGLSFGQDGRVTTFGALPSVPLSAPPGDGDYCVSSEGDLRFALPFGASEGAPRKQYRGVFSTGDDLAMVFREGEASLGVLVRLPEGPAPELVGDYRLVGLMRRNVIGMRAVQGRVGFDANGCLRGGEARFSDEHEPVVIPAGECLGIFTWLIGLRLDLGGGESYVLRGTSNHGGDVAVLTLHTGETTVGDALLLLVRELDLEGSVRAGEHLFARFDVDDEVASAARGRATVSESNEYLSYEEIALDGTRVTGEGGMFPTAEVPGGYREVSGERRGDERVRVGQAGELVLGRIAAFADVEVSRLSTDAAVAFPQGASLRIGVVRP